MNPASRQYILQVALPVPLPQVFDYFAPVEHGDIARGTRVLASFGKRQLVGIVTGVATKSDVPAEKILPVLKIFDDCEPLLNPELMGLLDWCCHYYKHSPGEIYSNALPPALRKAKGELPEPFTHYRLTRGGRERLTESPGRLKQQYALLLQLQDGSQSPEHLGDWSKGWRQTLHKVIDKGWVEPFAARLDRLIPANGPRLTAEQKTAIEDISADFGRFRCHLLDGITGSGKTEIYLVAVLQKYFLYV